MKPKKMPLHKQIELSHNTAKPFPFSSEAEKRVLGTVITIKNAFLKVASMLDSKHFYNERLSQIFTAVKDLFSGSEPIDIITVSERCKKLYPSAEITPFEIVALSENIFSDAGIEDHAQIIINKWGQRELMRLGNKMLYLSSSPAQGQDLKDLIALFGADFMKISQQAIPDKTESTLDITRRVLDKYLDPKNGIKGLSTGIKGLDDISDGLQDGELIIIGARPAMGKTSLLVSIANNLGVDQQRPVALFTYEMTKELIIERLISIRSGINGRKLGKEKLTQFEKERITKAADEINSAPIHIIEAGGLDVIGLRAKVIELKQQHNIEACFVDYLQRMPILKSVSRRNMTDAIGANTSGLASLAVEVKIPILVPSQLSRPPKGVTPKRPTLDTLRDSGHIEADAVKVWFIHRPEYYEQETLEDGQSAIGRAEIIQAKNRTGATGITTIGFNAPTTLFYDETETTFNIPENNLDNEECPF